MKNFLKDSMTSLKFLSAIIGTVSFVGWVLSLIYADNRLHATSHGHKYGPARHLGYLSDIIHRTSRAIDEAALSTYSKSAAEDARFFDELEDAREDVYLKHKYDNDSSYRTKMDEAYKRSLNRPDPADVIIADDTNPYDDNEPAF